MFIPSVNIKSYLKRVDMQKRVTAKMMNPMADSSRYSPKNDSTINLIYEKLKTGTSLTSYELDYLRENSPETYRKAIQIISERKDFRKKLDLCKTKEEAQSLKVSVSMSISSSFTSRQPEQLELSLIRSKAIDNEFIEFSKTEYYKKLPNERKHKDDVY